MVAGAGSNITLQVGDEGALLVDTGSARMADKTLAAIQHLTRQLTDQPIRWIINTHFHPDATGGNEVLAKAGQWVAQNISGGDAIVFFRHSDVIGAGGVYVTTTFPVIDVKAGGTINGALIPRSEMSYLH